MALTRPTASLAAPQTEVDQWTESAIWSPQDFTRPSKEDPQYHNTEIDDLGVFYWQKVVLGKSSELLRDEEWSGEARKGKGEDRVEYSIVE